MKIDDTDPLPFEKLGISIWRDPHVQKGMLATHLDPHTDLASRRPATIEKTVAWLGSLLTPRASGEAARPWRILDLGCGPGLYDERLAELGYEVTGIDVNGLSVSHARKSAREKGLAIRYVEGDYLSAFPPGDFDLIMMIYCDMGVLSDEDRDSLLASAFRALSLGGRLVFDVSGENLSEVKKERKTWDYYPAGGFWSPGEHLLLSRTLHYRKEKVFLDQYQVMTDEGVAAFRIWERYYSREEIRRVVERAGFTPIAIEDDVIPKNEYWPADVLFVTARKDR